MTGDEPDVCDQDPGLEVVATVATSLRTLIEIWRGDRPWSLALKRELVAVSGPGSRDVPRWLGQMRLAAVDRPE